MKIKLLLISLALATTWVGNSEGRGGQDQAITLPGEIGSMKGKKEDRWLGQDKLKHLMVSAFLTGIGYRICYEGLECRREHSKVLASSLTLSLGLGKELRDRQRGELFSYKDLIADLCGIGMGLLVFTSW